MDFVIDPTLEQLDAFVEGIPKDLYVSPQAARDALAERGMFNLVDSETSWKADLIIRKDRPFSREEFARRRPTTLFGCELFVVSPEDSILSKLEWARAGGSEQQIRDAESVASRAELDVAYLRRQAAALGISDLLDRVLAGSKS